SINNYFKAGSRKVKNYPVYAPLKAPTGNDSAVYLSGSLTPLTDIEQTLDQYRNFIIQAFLNYNRSFGRSNISALVMANRDNITLFGPSGDNLNPTANSTDPYRHNQASGRITYVYNDRYIAEVSGSYMGSDPFPEGKKYGFFPAASVGWIASEERFLKNSDIVNFLKFRGSYGIVGNDIIVPLGLSSRYSLYTQTFGGAGYFLGTSNGSVGGLSENILANPDLTWEKEKITNIGIDASVFRNFNVSFDYFNRDRYDILVSATNTLPQYLGVASPGLNQGKANSKGFEFSLTYNKKNRNGLQFSIGTNITYSRNNIVFNAEALQLNSQLYRSGARIGQPFLLKAIGFFTQEEIDQRAVDPRSIAAPTTEIIRAGDLKYEDIGGPAGKPDGIIDGNDQSAIGNTNIPRLVIGLHGGFRYKGFDVDMVFQGVSGNTVYLGGSYFHAFQNNGQISPIAVGRWTPETAASATYPRLSSSANNQNNFLGSSFWQRNGAFIKMRSAEIGYTLPSRISSKVKVGVLRFFATGTNLFSLDYVKYGDPESLTGYPVTRTITLGAKIQL
ncbi:MAG: SusC/RagA family TonB-linked outer membrane protein, partial [Chitinophagaceae bacterium]|nr:SusC/RagA family TonB-linked outer membrane protein [Chitinophagaceae bacterium]